MSAQFGLPKVKRLPNTAAFAAVLQRGRVSKDRWLAVYALPNNLQFARLGVNVAKKVASHAHQRNRIKRVFRETFRKQQNHLSGYDVVIIARSNANTAANATLQQRLSSHWEQVIPPCESS